MKAETLRKRLFPDSQKRVRRVALLVGAGGLAILGLFVHFRPGAPAAAPRIARKVAPADPQYQRITDLPARKKGPAPEVDPLEGSRSAPAAVKAPPKSKSVPTTANPIFASAGKGPDRFQIRDRNVSAFFTDRGVTLAMVFPKAVKGPNGLALKWGLEGASAVAPQPTAEGPSRINRFVGDSSQWQTNLPSYSGVYYPGVKSGVDLLVESLPHALKYTVQLEAGADPESLRFRYEGASEIQVSADGSSLEVVTPMGPMVENQLHCWQDAPGGRVGVQARYVRTGPTGYAIQLGQTDPTLPVTVDPTFTWATYLGGSLSPNGGDDTGYAIASDTSLNTYVAGQTSCADFPATAGAFQTTHALSPDAWIAKFSSSGALLWSTFLGGNSEDLINSIRVDQTGSPTGVYVGGYTYSSNFPTTPGAFLRANPNQFQMGFAAKLSASDSSMIWSTLLGGQTSDQDVISNVTALQVDGGSNVYAAGYTSTTDFPIIGATVQTTYGGGSYDAFVAKIRPDGTGLVWSTYLGQFGDDYAYAIDVDPSSNVYVGGSTSGPFQTTGSAFRKFNSGGNDCFVTKLNSAGNNLVWSTFVGGIGDDQLRGLCLDNSVPPNAYITGWTSSTNWPIVSAAQGFLAGAYDSFVAKINSDGSTLGWSTYLGGSANDLSYGISYYSGNGDLYIAGTTNSTNFPHTVSAYQPFNHSLTSTPSTGFIARYNSAGALGYSSYFGGSGSDQILATTSYLGWNFVTGNTTSSNLPVTGGVWSTSLSGPSDAFDVRFNPYNSGPSCLIFGTYLGGAHGQGYSGSAAGCVALDDSGNSYVAGYTSTIDYPLGAGGFQNFLGAPNSINCVVSKILDNGSTLAWSTYLGGSNYSYPQGLAVNSAGEVYVTGYTYSGATNFPTTAGAWKSSMGSASENSFVSHLSADGKSLLFSTFLGGSTNSYYATSIALDPNGNVYVSGYTYSNDFPTGPPGVIRMTFGGSSDSFLTKFTPTGSAILWSTLIGGTAAGSSDFVFGLAVDSSGSAYVTGYTTSADFPTTAGAFSNTFNTTTGVTPFLSKVNPGGTAYAYSTFFGGSQYTTPYTVVVDSSGDAYVGGYTTSSNYPVLNGYQMLLSGSSDGFITKFNPAGSGLVWSTFLGGTGDEAVQGLALDARGNIYATGYTTSTDFPTTAGLNTFYHGGSTDAFAARISAAGNTLSWSTYLGGSDYDYGFCIAVNASSNVTVAGYTYSTDLGGAAAGFQTKLHGSSDLFLARIKNEAPNPPSSLAQYRSNGTTVIATGGATNETTIIMKGVSGDPEGDKYKMQMEIRDDLTALVGPTVIPVFGTTYFESALVPSGTTATVTVSGKTAGIRYHWAARSMDAAGVASPWVSYGGNAENPPTSPAAADFRIDQTAPTIAIVSPSSSGTYNTNLTTVALSGTAGDDVQVFNVTWTNAGNTTNGTASGTASWNIPSISLTGGSNVITVTVTDTAGNTAFQQINVIQDASPPSLTITSPTTNSTYVTATSPLTLGATASDNVGVIAVTWSNSTNSTNGPASFAGGLWTTSSITLVQGLNNLAMAAQDAAGNITFKTIGVTYDPNPPLLSVTTPTPASTFSTNAASVVLGGTASDALTSVALVQYQNTTTAGTLTTGSGTTSWTTGSILLAAGTNVIHVIATDAAGNATTATVNVIQDSQPPSVNINTPTAGPTFITNSSSIAMSGTASDAGTSGLSTVTWSNPATSGFGTASGTSSWSIATIGLNTGSNAISVTATDFAGNSASKVLTVTYDPTAPSVTFTTPASTPTYTTAASALIAGTASDNVGVAAIDWRNNLGAYSSASGTLTSWSVSAVPLVVGSNTIDVRATDSAGNPFVKTIVIQRDNTPPSISISSPAVNPFYTTASSILVAGTSSDASGVSLVDYQVGGSGPFTAASGTTSWSIPALPLAAGANSLVVRATDLAGNQSTATVSIIRDNTPPAIAITTNGGSSFATSTTPLALSGTASDNLLVSQVQWQNNGGAFSTASGTTGWNTSIPLAAGANNILVQAVDGAGNTSFAAITVTLDQTNPSVTITSPTSLASYSTASTPLTTLAGTASDNVALSSVLWRVNGGAYTATSGTLGSWNVPSIPLNTGTNTVDVKATDTAGNPFVKSLTVILDTTPPSATITSPVTNPAYTTGGTIVIAGTASDNNSVSLVEWRRYQGAPSGTFAAASGTASWSVPSVPLLAGSNTIEIRTTDAAGNTSVISTVVIRDNTSPSIAISTNGGLDFVTNATPLNLSGTASDDFLVAQVQWQDNGGGFSPATNTTSWTASIPLVAGLNAIVVRATDGAGNTKTASINVTYSTGVPTVTITSPTSSPTFVTGSSTVSLAGTASDATGIQKIEYRVLPTPTYTLASGQTAWSTGAITISPGSSTIEVRATDNASNTASTSITVTYDNVPPSLAITGPTSSPTFSTNASSVILSGTVSDGGGGTVASVTWSNAATTSGPANIAGGTWTSSTAIPVVAGLQVITVVATDSVGNTSSKAITVNVDVGLPTVSITSPTSPHIRNSTPVPVQFTATDPGPNPSGVASVGWTRAEGGGASGSAVFVSGTTWSANIPLVAGVNTITPTCTDAAGNTASGNQLIVTLDQTAPALAITSPTSASTTSTKTSPIAVSGTVSDGGGGSVQVVNWSTTGAVSPTSGTATLGSGTWTIPAVNLALGSQTLTVTAVDSAGNSSAPRTLVIIYDTTAPTVSVNPVAPPIGNVTPLALTFAASDSGASPSGVASVAWTRAEGGGASGSAVFVSGTTWSANIPLVAGVNTITPTCTDAAGNVATGSAFAYTLDQTGPAVAVTTPVATGTYYTNALSLAAGALGGTVTDSGGGTVTGVNCTNAANSSSSGATVAGGTWTTTGAITLAVGSQVITVTSTDSVGNVSNTTLTVIVDQSAPSVQITSPTSAPPALSFTTGANPLVMGGTASDTGLAGLQNVTFTNVANGSTFASGTASGLATWSASVNLTAAFSNNITITAKDLAGNTSSVTLIVTLNTSAPTVQITSPTAASTYNTSGTSVTLGGTATPASLATITLVEYSTDNGVTFNPATGTTSWTTPLIALGANPNSIIVRATDNSSLTGSDTLTVIQDSTPPGIAITTNSGGDFVTSASPALLAGTASDTGGSNLATVVWANAATSGTGAATGTSSWTGSVPLTPGPNLITFTATDGAGNTSFANITVTYDLTAPDLAITTPSSTGTFTTASTTLATLAGTTSDNVAVATLDYRINGVGPFLSIPYTAPAATWSVSSVALGSGMNVILVRATDTGGNQTSRQLTVTLDNVAPAVAITSPSSSGTFLTNSSSVTLGGTASDNLSLASVTWANAANAATGIAGGLSNWSAPGIPLAVGANVITVKATDSLGNIKTDVTTVTYDPTPPSVAITSPASPTFVTKLLSISLNGTASDNVALASVTASNSANGSTGTFSGTLASFTFGGITLAAGTNVITVTATDTAGNAANAVVTVTCDTTPPSIAIASPTSGPSYLTSVTPLQISGTASDNVSVASVSWSNSAGGSGAASGTSSWSASVALSPGLNTIIVAATDTAGNSQSATLAVTYDNGAPSVAVTTPASATFATNSSPFVLAGTASDPQGISSVKWSNAATGGTGTANGTTSWTASVPLAIGSNAITLAATDGAGNTTTALSTIILDTTAPSVTITGPSSASSYITKDASLTLSGTVADNVGVASVSWSTTGTVLPLSGTATVVGGSWSDSSLVLTPGVQVITVTATDTAGNSAITTITVTLDATVPTITITSPTALPTYITGGSTLAIGGTAADNIGISTVTWSRVEAPVVSGTAAGTTAWSASVPLILGTNTYEFVATDTAGNVSPTATLVVTLDVTAPAVQITGPTSLPAYSTNVSPVFLVGSATDLDGISSVTWSNTATGGTGSATYATPSWDVNVPLEIGANPIIVTATDVAGNTSTTTITVTFDVTPPALAISAPTAGASFVTSAGSLALSGTMSDNVGVTTVHWSTTGVVVPASGSAVLNTPSAWSVAAVNLAIGSQVVTLTASDAAGNTSSAALTVILDNTAPGVVITGPTSAGSTITNNGTILLSGTASDNVGVASVVWSNSTGGSGTAVGTTSWNASVPLLAGLNTITVTATDTAGTTSTDQIAVTFDATLPTVSVTAPTAGPTFYTNSGPVLLGGAAGDNQGLASVKWTNAATGGSGTATGTAAWTASIPLASGANPITVTSTDIAGNVSLPSTLDVILDTVLPTATISLPTPQALFITSGATVDLGGTATDNVGVLSVTCANTANGAIGVVVGTNSWTVTALPLVAGDNPITVTVSDQAGNSNSASITVRQDSVPPSVVVTLPTSSGTAFTNASPLAISGTAGDNVGVSSVAWSNPAVPASGIASGTAAWSAAVPLVAGLNTITITATDTAGNTSTAVLSATLDTTAPTISTTGPTNQPVFNTATSSATLSGSAADAGGLSSVAWSNAATGASGTTVGTTSWSAAVPLTPGTNVITITATDSAGNSATSVITIIHDTVAPTVNISVPSSAANYNSPTSPLVVGGTASDNVGITSVGWSNSATGGSGVAAGTAVWSASIPLVEGTNQITVTAVDAVGNAATDTITVNYDPTAPGIAITNPTALPTYSTTTTPLDFAGTSADNISVASVTWTNLTTGTTGSATGTLSWTASVPLTSGPNVIVFTATDDVGNPTTASITVTYDVTAPVVTIVSPTPPSVTTQTRPLVISGTATDNVGVTNVTWSNGLTGGNGPAAFAAPSWSASIPLIPGANVITIRASDALGNIGSATLTVNYSFETVPPLITIDPSLMPGFASASQLPTIFGTASDNVGVTSVTWVNKTTGAYGVATGTISWTSTIPLTAGTNVIEFTASDDVGNLAIQDVTVTFAAPANSNPPGVTITAPTSSATFTTTSSPLNLECTTIDDVGVVTVRWTNAGTSGDGLCGWGSFWYAPIPLVSGTNVITVTATDTSGNTATDVVTVTYNPPVGDPVPPLITITAPAGSGTVNVTVPQVSLSGTASDNASVATVTYNNAGTGQGATAAGTTSWSANAVPLAAGVNFITARAIDPSGNVGQAALVVVYTPPAAAKPIAPTIPAGMCGLTGLESLLVLGAVWLGARLRRRRAI